MDSAHHHPQQQQQPPPQIHQHQQQLHPHHPTSASALPEGQIGFDQLPPHAAHHQAGVPGVSSGPAPAHVAVAPHDSAAMKLTRGHSCVLCQQRKVRCDKNKPCANCVKAGVECRVVPPQPPRRRKKKPHERELVDRLRKYELLLNQHGVSFEPLGLGGLGGSGDAGGRETTLEELDELQHDLGGLKTSPSSSNLGNTPDRSENANYYTNYRDYRPDVDQDSSDDEVDPGATIHHAFDTMFDHQDGFPFVIGGSMTKVTDAHPTGIQMFQLWQIYLTNVNPLLKITHTHSLQAKIIEAGADRAKIPRPLEALLFSIYFIAITSMPEADVQSTFAEDKSQLLAKYHRACQQALVNVGFMRSSDLAVLQAYLLYLVSLIPIALPTYQQSQICVRQYVDPRALFCLIGIAVRIAQRLGLHRDGAQFGLPPFEIELRRRLWWQLVAFDKRIAEITGATVNALSSSNGDCKWPLNINDTDLHVHAKESPIQYNGPTEMLFCLTRIEMTTANAPDGMRPSPRQVGTPATNDRTRRFHYSPSPSSPDIVTHIATEAMPDNLDAYSAYIESTYLKTCDPKIPLHLFTLLMTRMALCKLHLIEFLVRQSKQQAAAAQQAHLNLTTHPSPSNTTTSGPHSTPPHHGPTSHPHQPGTMPPPYAHHPPINTPHPATTLATPERDALFLEAVRMIEYDNILQSTPSLRGFAWYTYMHFPLPGYMYLVGEMRARKTGELVERAWDAVCENHELRGLTKNLRSPIHVAFGGHFIKAWDAREQAEARLGKRLETPKFIVLMRTLYAKYRPQQKGHVGAAQPAVSGPAVGDRQGDEGIVPGGYQPVGTGGAQQQQIHEQQAAAAQGGMMGAPPVQQEMVMEDTASFFPSMQYIQQVMMGGGQDIFDSGPMDWNYAPQGGGFDAGAGPGGPGIYGGGPMGGGPVYPNMFGSGP